MKIIAWFLELFWPKAEPEPVLPPLIAAELDYEWLVSKFTIDRTYNWGVFLGALHERYGEVSYDEMQITFKVLRDLGYKYEDKNGDDNYTPEPRYGNLWYQIAELQEAV